MRTPGEQLRAWARVNLGALERNLRAIRAAMPAHLRYIGVVKANAYGHGLAPVVTRLMRSEADAFAVANLDEASRLREVGEGWPILVLSALLPEEIPEACRLGVLPVLSSPEEVRAFADEAARQGTQLPVHLKVDTGMGRLGIWYPRFPEMLAEMERTSALRLAGVCTHFSSADSDPAFTRLQRERFLGCLRQLPVPMASLLLHADNSAGVESFPDGGPFNAVRIGLLQFGVRPRPGGLLQPRDIEPVLSFHSRIGLVKQLPAGTPISYGQTYRLRKDSRIAVLTAGYADGIPTSLSNRGEVLVRGRRCPVIGRVTMDQTIVDLSALSPSPEAGETATFIGAEGVERLTVSDFARASGQVEWEVFCSLSARTKRVYHTDTAV
jgi:alanine racemase